MLNIAIVDDEKPVLTIIRGTIESFLSEKAILCAIKAFSSPLAFVSTLQDTAYDLIFLDVDMPELSGVDVAKKIKNRNYGTTIIFLSQREDLVFDCLSLHPFGFVRKNKLIEDFSKIMDLYLEIVYQDNSKRRIIQIQTKKSVTSVEINSLVYIEGNGNYQNLNMKDQTIVSARIRMRKLEEMLEPYGFLRIHKGFLVNCAYIRRIDSKEVVLLNETTLPISRQNKEEVFQEYLRITRKKDSLLLS